MKEDYLWDKSGEVDDEIEQLENMLGSFRYKRPAEPLPLPASSRHWFRLNSTLLAAAAAIALLLFAGGLWLGLNRSGSNNPATVSGPPPPTGPVNTTGGSVAGIENKQPPEPITKPQDVITPRVPRERRQFVQVKYSEAKRARELRAAEFLRRGELAKEQLIKALQITSEKLSVFQKKILGVRESGPIS
jgi:hypothetical protein